ncbi:MAG: S8 family serine peptidase [Mycobacteriales bacterium]
MSPRTRTAVPVILLAAALAAGLAATGGGVRAATPTAPSRRAACPALPAPYAHCLTWYTPRRAGARPLADGDQPNGWGATDLRAAYQVPAGDTTATVAVSIAYDQPNLESDLAAYRARYGLPPCTSASGCLRKVNQAGAAGPLPDPNFNWALEATLDVSMISAACPTCHLLVVEANSADITDLAATEDTAIALGAQVVSNSYGIREGGLAMRYAAHYNHPGHPITVSSGDAGFTSGSFPAVLDSVTAVGGTTLARTDAGGWTESAWLYGGSACSAYVAKPAWQHDPHCPGRTVADVAAVADNLALYYADAGGWLTVSGTSASAPFVAGLYGLAGDAPAPGALYQHAGALTDVTTGTNDIGYGGAKCQGDYLCVAAPGYDAPTGLGTPKGVAAF